MKISLGCDHAGYEYKEAIKSYLIESGHTVCDHGTKSSDSVDYADFAHPVSIDVASHHCDYAVLVCGSGNGVAMTANKHNGIRAAICWTTEIAMLARKHNDANIICIPARFTAKAQAKEMVLKFLSTDFEGGRHKTRVDKIPYSC